MNQSKIAAMSWLQFPLTGYENVNKEPIAKLRVTELQSVKLTTTKGQNLIRKKNRVYI